jgi:hypothetical protein
VSSALAHGTPAPGSFGGQEAVPERRHAVFISDFLHLGRPFHELSALLLDPVGPWLGAAKRSAAQQRFTLTAGQPRQYDSVVIVPMHWEPIAFERRVPALDADIELSSLGADHCRLSLSGRYRVPLAQLEANIERLAMHRAAESAMRRFLSEIAQSLVAP